MALIVLRFVFVMVAVGLGVQLINSPELPHEPAYLPWLVFGGLMLLSAAVIGGDMYVRRKQLDTVSAVYLGLLVGLFLTYVLRLALLPILPPNAPITQWAELVLGMVLCYTCISLLLQTKDDFRFIIPYVEFVKEVKGLKPYVLDTSVVIDGRIADVVETQDSRQPTDHAAVRDCRAAGHRRQLRPLRRSRGRRGLDILNRLRNDPDVDFKIYDRELPEFAGQPVDLKLVLLAKHLTAKS